MSDERESWDVPLSDMAGRIRNPIRLIVDSKSLEPNPDMPVIPLSIGLRPEHVELLDSPMTGAALQERSIAFST